jgi:hypothetical protein
VKLARARPQSISERACSRIARPSCQPDAYGRAALDREINELAQARPGTRNHALIRASFSLHQLVAGGKLDGAEVEQRLIAAAEANGLLADPGDGPRKVRATIRSGARAGMQNPRNRSGRL